MKIGMVLLAIVCLFAAVCNFLGYKGSAVYFAFGGLALPFIGRLIYECFPPKKNEKQNDSPRSSEAGSLTIAWPTSRSQPITNLRLRPRIGSLVRFRICGEEAKGVVAAMTGCGRFGRATISNFASRGADRVVRRIRDLSLVSFN